MSVEIWYENGRGLLFQGWYTANDECLRRGPFDTKEEAEAAVEQAEYDDQNMASVISPRGLDEPPPTSAGGAAGSK